MSFFFFVRVLTNNTILSMIRAISERRRTSAELSYFLQCLSIFFLLSWSLWLVSSPGRQGVACVVSVVIGWRPRLMLSPVEHVLVPPQIVPGTQTWPRPHTITSQAMKSAMSVCFLRSESRQVMLQRQKFLTLSPWKATVNSFCSTS